MTATNKVTSADLAIGQHVVITIDPDGHYWDVATRATDAVLARIVDVTAAPHGRRTGRYVTVTPIEGPHDGKLFGATTSAGQTWSTPQRWVSTLKRLTALMATERTQDVFGMDAGTAAALSKLRPEDVAYPDDAPDRMDAIDSEWADHDAAERDAVRADIKREGREEWEAEEALRASLTLPTVADVEIGDTVVIDVDMWGNLMAGAYPSSSSLILRVDRIGEEFGPLERRMMAGWLANGGPATLVADYADPIHIVDVSADDEVTWDVIGQGGPLPGLRKPTTVPVAEMAGDSTWGYRVKRDGAWRTVRDGLTTLQAQGQAWLARMAGLTFAMVPVPA